MRHKLQVLVLVLAGILGDAATNKKKNDFKLEQVCVAAAKTPRATKHSEAYHYLQPYAFKKKDYVESLHFSTFLTCCGCHLLFRCISITFTPFWPTTVREGTK